MARDWFGGIGSSPGGRSTRATGRAKPRGPSLGELIAAKNYPRAIEVLRAQFAGRPATTQMRLQLADLLFLAGRREEALPVLLALADELTSDGFVAKAIAILKRIEKVEPGRADVEERLTALVQKPGAGSMRSSTVPALPALDAAAAARSEPAFGMEELGAETLTRIKNSSAMKPVTSGTPWEPDVDPEPPPAPDPDLFPPSPIDVAVLEAPPPPAAEPEPGPVELPLLPDLPAMADPSLEDLLMMGPAPAAVEVEPDAGAPLIADENRAPEIALEIAAPPAVGPEAEGAPETPAAAADPTPTPRGMSSVLKRLLKALPLGLGSREMPAVDPQAPTPSTADPAAAGEVPPTLAGDGTPTIEARLATDDDLASGDPVVGIVADDPAPILVDPFAAEVAEAAGFDALEVLDLDPPHVPDAPSAADPILEGVAEPAPATDATGDEAAVEPPPLAEVPVPAEATIEPVAVAAPSDPTAEAAAESPDAQGAKDPGTEAPPEEGTDAAATIATRLGGAFKRFLATLSPTEEEEAAAAPAAQAAEALALPESAGAETTDRPVEAAPESSAPPGTTAPPPQLVPPAAAPISEEIDVRGLSGLLDDLDASSSDDLFPEVFVDDEEPARVDPPADDPALSLASMTPMSDEKFQGQVLDLIEEVLQQPAAPSTPGEGPHPGDRDVILTHPLFQDLSEKELLAVLRAMKHHSFEAGQIIVTEGEAGGSLFVLITGGVKLSVRNPTGRNVVVGELTEGAFFGEMSVLSGKPRTATVTAAAVCELLEIDKKTLDGIAYAHPRVRDILDSFYVQRASSDGAAAVRVAPVFDEGMRRKADEVLKAYFGDREFDSRMQLTLASVLLKAGKATEAIPVLVELADDLLRSGHPAKAIAILKKIESLRRRDTEFVSLAPLIRRDPNPDETLPPVGRPGPAGRVRPGTSVFFQDWLVDAVRRTVQPPSSKRTSLRPELGTNPLLQDLTEDELMTILRDVRLRTFAAGEIILTEGEPGSALFLLTTGAVRIFVRDPRGTNIEIAEMSDGGFFGEMATLSGRPRNATITAAARCEILELEKATVDAMTAAHPQVRKVLEEFSLERATRPDVARIRRGASD